MDTLTKKLTIRRREHWSEIHSNKSQQLTEDTEVARLDDDSLLFYGRYSHSARDIISADRG